MGDMAQSSKNFREGEAESLEVIMYPVEMWVGVYIQLVNTYIATHTFFLNINLQARSCHLFHMYLQACLVIMVHVGTVVSP